ncbi:AAA domain-containing protein [Streptomyces sp. 8N616]|uniref:AAA domain-containing protein n=1 Tax=Streptomyces sp. 8N616 TaxID=3457414 RepID=UPI003FD415F8
MKGLYFHAVAGHPNVAPALMRQTSSTLRPFNRFLGQAIHTAKQRQFRYQLPWEPVRDLQQVHLTALDRRVLVPRRKPAWHVTDWPADAVPDVTQPLMAVNRSAVINVLDYHRDAAGLRLDLDSDLREDDQVFWCGRRHALAREAAPPPPSSVEDAQGAGLRLVRTPEPEEDGWVLVVEGWNGEGDLVVDGEPVEPHVLPEFEGLRRLRDAEGRSYELTGGTLKVEELPAEGLLTGDNGVRFAWAAPRRGGGRGSKGSWVQLLPPENTDPEDFLDPRAAFCEGEVDEVWTQARHSRNTVFKVKRVDSDRYQLLLDRLPPRGASLFLPVNIRNLQLQRRALRQLTDAPLPHHHGLLRLCENPERVRWPAVRPAPPERWTELTDPTRSGTEEQRAFVAKALGSPDLAILEGPPGSGKTTAICELVRQLIADDERVLLCASTHVAIDNVLERLLDAGAPVDAVRIGRTKQVDEKVQATQIDHKVEALVESWRAVPHLSVLGEGELAAMAERTVVSAANLTCGTTMGIVNHPLFDAHEQERNPRERSITSLPHWDVLIVDEASKTLIQEFLVPALMARRWIVVGDIHQLPPFADRADIVANLRSLADENDREVLPPDHQRACLLLFRLARRALRRTEARWLVVEPPGVLDRLGEELAHREDFPLSVARVVARTGERKGPFLEVSAERIRAGDPAALALAACDWVLVGDDVLPEVADHLPADLLHHRDLTALGGRGLPETHPLLFRHAWWLERAGRLPASYWERRDEISTFAGAESCERRWLSEHDLANEIAWRLTRIHELKHGRDQREPERLSRQLRELLPAAVDISEPVAEIQDIGLPSILEVLQEGIGDGRARASALTEGLPNRQAGAFRARFGSLSYQHRMHADISALPRALVYGGKSLLDANTIDARDRDLAWNFGSFRGRRAWVDVRGRERGGVNEDEVRVMEAVVREFLAWARKAGPPRRASPPVWEVACLCFYVRQEGAISDMLRRVSGDDRRSRFRVGNVEIVCGTVDRFQGREADLVLLSMRNTARVGFLDSRNRLNVAITRARQQLVVVGNAGYFAGCRTAELEELARHSSREDARNWLKGSGGSMTGKRGKGPR